MTTENSAVAISATPKKVSRKPAGSGKKTAKKKAAKKSAKKGAKKPAKKRESNGISGKAKSLLTTLLAAGATSAKNAMDKEKALKKADVTTSTVITLKELKLIERVDHEDGSRAYFLSAEGKSQATAASKEE